MYLIKIAPGLHKGEMLNVIPNVTVDDVSGIIEAYETDAGELRGRFTEDIDDGQTVNLRVTYDRTLNNGDKKQFTCFEKASEENRDISLSKSPWRGMKGWYVTNVSIEVTYDNI